MPNPKRRHSNTRTRLRRSHDFLKPGSHTQCAQCGAPVRPHHVCPSCGFYRGKQVVMVEVKDKAEKNKKP